MYSDPLDLISFNLCKIDNSNFCSLDFLITKLNMQYKNKRINSFTVKVASLKRFRTVPWQERMNRSVTMTDRGRYRYPDQIVNLIMFKYFAILSPSR
jgi:hypothetical protein